MMNQRASFFPVYTLDFEASALEHGYPIENEWGGSAHKLPPEDDRTKTLIAENEQLKATVGRLEERLKVLERIATDPSHSLSDEIEKLR